MHPPYTPPDLAPAVQPGGEEPASPAFGALAVLRIECPRHEESLVPVAAVAVRTRYPAHPLIVWTPTANAEAVHLATCAGRCQVRAVVTGSEDHGADLRRLLSRCSDPAPDIMEWIALRGIRLRPRLAHIVRQILDLAPQHVSVGELLRVVREPEASVRASFRSQSLPSPGEWFRLARALKAALELQAEPEMPLLRASYRLGYSDPSVLSQQIHRTFHLRPTAVRRVLGWEGLVDRWLQRALPETHAPCL